MLFRNQLSCNLMRIAQVRSALHLHYLCSRSCESCVLCGRLVGFGSCNWAAHDGVP